jgi:hypothetical protein
MTLDKDTAEQLRKEMANKQGNGSSKAGGKKRGPQDSGKGVRIQVMASQLLARRPAVSAAVVSIARPSC